MGGLFALQFALKYGMEKKKFWLAFLSILFFVLGILSKKSILPFSVLVPISMILFTGASYAQVFFISLIMSLITTLFSPLFYLSHQVFMFLALMSIPSITYWLVRTKNFSLNNIVEFIKKQTTHRSNPEAQAENIEVDNTAQTSLSVLYIVLLSLSSIALVAFGLAFNILALSLIGICFAVFQVFRSSEKQFQWSALVLALLITGISYIYQNGLLPQASIVFYAYLIFTRKVKLNVVFSVLILGALSVAYASVDIVNIHIVPVYLAAVFLYAQKNNYLKISGFVLTAVICLVHSPFAPINSITHLFMVALLAYDHLKLKQRPIQRVWFVYAPLLLIISNVFFTDLEEVWRNTNYEMIGAETPDIFPASGRELEYAEMPLTTETPATERVGTSFYVLAKYLKLVIIPYPLGFYYGYSEIPVVEWTHWLSILSIIIHLIFGLVALFFIRRKPILSYGIIFYIGCLSIFSNLAAPVAGLMADRYLLSASLGFCIILAWGLFKLFKVDINDTKLQLKSIPKNLTIVLGAILLLYSVETFARNFKWKDQLTLFQNDIEHLEKSAQAHNLLAIHLTKKAFTETDQTSRTRYFSEAKKHFEKALEIDESFFNARFDHGRVAAALGEYPQAIASFKQVFAMDSTFYNALIEVALIYDQQNMPDRAIPIYRKIIDIDSNYLPAYTNLSLNYFKQKRFQEAIEVNKEALRVMPEAYDPYVNIGKTYFNMGKKDSALVYFEKAYQIDQTDAMLQQIMVDIRRELGK